MVSQPRLDNSVIALMRTLFPSFAVANSPYPRDFIAESQRAALRFVPSSYFDQVMRIVSEYPSAAAQAIQLQEVANQHRSRADVRVGELIAGVDVNGEPRLEQYIRIDAERETFDAVKASIRDNWKVLAPDQERLVTPVILRKVRDV